MDSGDFGFTLVEDFITTDEEAAILAEIPRKAHDRRRKERNAVFRYGKRHIYTSDFVSKHVPTSILKIGRRLKEQGCLPAIPSCITVNQYHQGQIIKPHYDDPKCGPVITVLSLLAPATIRFYHSQHPSRVFELPPRSISFMQGESRLSWQHGVDPVPAERYSIVFRA
jgi:alkylated DNA repair dioxygenase AlkB